MKIFLDDCRLVKSGHVCKQYVLLMEKSFIFYFILSILLLCMYMTINMIILKNGENVVI